MMKVVYVISLGHSGSTLLDLILGTHPEVISSGELRYLNWQLTRTLDRVGGVQEQDVCSCGADFRSCSFWSNVFQKIKGRTGVDLAKDPESFNTAYFNQFSYKNRGGYNVGFYNRALAYITREWCELGYNYRNLLIVTRKVDEWVSNNWILYESMSEVGQKPVIVDSSKHILIALLLQQNFPKNVLIVFLHRELAALVSSRKKWQGDKFSRKHIHDVIKQYNVFKSRIEKVKRNIPDLDFIDINYGDLTSRPADILNILVDKLNLKNDFPKQGNNNFYIYPNIQHLVAGNPMRYKGTQRVTHDDSWKSRLTNNEISILESAIRNL